MSTLFINEKYYNKLLEPNVEKVLNLYGYLNREDYLKKLINFLNEKYPFLNISNIKFMDGKLLFRQRRQEKSRRMF